MFRRKVCKNIMGDTFEMKVRYEEIDKLKVYAIIGIGLIHILSNGEYELG